MVRESVEDELYALYRAGVLIVVTVHLLIQSVLGVVSSVGSIPRRRIFQLVFSFSNPIPDGCRRQEFIFTMPLVSFAIAD